MLNLFLWGTGMVAKQVMQQCLTLENYCIQGFIDNDKSKQGTVFMGKEIYSPDVLQEKRPDRIVVLSDAYQEIYDQIVREYPQYSECVENKNYFYKESILKRYHNCQDQELQEVIQYIKENGLSVFNYSFAESYYNKEVQVFWDEIYEHFYVIYNGHRMYFSKQYITKESAADYYRSILLEQDQKSPHKYLTEEFNVKDGDVVVDVGAAEGIFSLDVIEKAKKIYIIEADEQWIQALKLTFKQYSDKVIIIKGFVNSYDEFPFITLDSVIDDCVNFIKMDIEGNEWDGLIGASKLLEKTSDLKLAVCVYHSDFDRTLVESFMDQKGISHHVSKGYMWFPTPLRQTYISTCLNKALVYGYKSGV